MWNEKYPLYWRIASASASLPTSHFFALKLPPVNLCDYRTYTQEIPRSTGAISRQGYINCNLLWDDMDFLQLRTLNKIVITSVTNGIIYLTLDRSFGIKLANDFIDVSGVPHPLTFSQISNARGIMYQNINLIVTNITVTADPSSVVVF